MLTVPQEIKDLLHQDTCPKNIRIHFPNMERTDICNDMIVKDSVSFTESLCSQNELKFGLAEAPVFECEVVGVENIKGAQIEVFCEIFCDSSVDGAVWQTDLEGYVYQIPYGVFVVNTCERQADMQHRKIVAYSFVMSGLDKVDPSIAAKDRIGLANNYSYNPNIFATMIVNSGTKGILTRATYTEVTVYNGASIFNIYSNFNIPGSADEYVQLRINHAVFSAGNYSSNDLYYKTGGEIIQTQEDALLAAVEDLKENRPSASYTDEVIEQLKVFFLEQLKNKGNHYEGKWELGVGPRTFGISKNSYLYPYFADEITQFSGVDDVCIFTGLSLRCLPSSWVEPIEFSQDFINVNSLKVYEVDHSNYPQTKYSIPRDIRESGQYYYDASKVDYYKLAESMLELSSLFWYCKHDGNIELVNLKQQFGLIPDPDLYPGSSLYPESVVGGKLLPKDYQSCWYDDEYTKPFGAIICLYKNTSEQSVQYTYYMSGYDSETDIDSYSVYDLRDNYIIQNGKWTQAQIESICSTIASNIEGVTYMPVDFVGRGLPYVEAGDTFEIFTRSNDSITTIVLNRTISGEQMLTDTYKSV